MMHTLFNSPLWGGLFSDTTVDRMSRRPSYQHTRPIPVFAFAVVFVACGLECCAGCDDPARVFLSVPAECPLWNAMTTQRAYLRGGVPEPYRTDPPALSRIRYIKYACVCVCVVPPSCGHSREDAPFRSTSSCTATQSLMSFALMENGARYRFA